MVYEYYGWSHIYATKGSNQPPRYLKKGFDAFKASNYLNIECEKTSKQFYIRIGTFSKGTGVFSMQGQAKGRIPRSRMDSKTQTKLTELMVAIVANFPVNNQATQLPPAAGGGILSRSVARMK
jgi:hypothetical protein